MTNFILNPPKGSLKAIAYSVADEPKGAKYYSKICLTLSEAKEAYKYLKSISKYEPNKSLCWAFKQNGRLTWLPR